MTQDKEIFNISYRKKEKVVSYILNIEELENEQIEIINQYFVKICEGDSERDLDVVKKRLLKFLESKDINTKMGAVAEFFMHLVLNVSEYKQECLYLNLEEGSIKKGFDGYYSKDGEEWVAESKSGSITTDKISHPNKLKEAYLDLKDKFQGAVSNNPWQNAYNHASHIDVSADKKIRKNLSQLSEDFINKQWQDISKFNIIPTSTIYFADEWVEVDSDRLGEEVYQTAKDFDGNKVVTISINHKTIDTLIQYLKTSN